MTRLFEYLADNFTMFLSTVVALIAYNVLEDHSIMFIVFLLLAVIASLQEIKHAVSNS